MTYRENRYMDEVGARTALRSPQAPILEYCRENLPVPEEPSRSVLCSDWN
jgi:hypothetical protein